VRSAQQDGNERRRQVSATRLGSLLEISVIEKGLESTLTDVSAEVVNYCRAVAGGYGEYIRGDLEVYDVIKRVYILGLRQGKKIESERIIKQGGSL